MNRGLALWLALVLALSVCLAAAAEDAPEADESLATVVSQGYFVVGLDDSFPPMSFLDEGGELAGFDVDLAKEVAARIGVEPKFQTFARDAREVELLAGNIDCVWGGMAITPARLSSLSVSVAYLGDDQCFIAKTGGAIAGLEDMTGKWLGYTAGSAADDALTDDPDFRVTLGGLRSFTDGVSAAAALADGGIDVILLNRTTADYVLAQNPGSFELIDESLALCYYGVGFRKADIALTDAVNEALRAMAQDGTLAEISAKWLGSDQTTVADPPDDPAFMQDAVVDEEDASIPVDYEEGEFLEEDAE